MSFSFQVISEIQESEFNWKLSLIWKSRFSYICWHLLTLEGSWRNRQENFLSTPFFIRFLFRKRTEKNSLRFEKMKKWENVKSGKTHDNTPREGETSSSYYHHKFPKRCKRGWTERDKSSSLYDGENFLIVVFVKIFRLSHFPPFSVTLARKAHTKENHKKSVKSWGKIFYSIFFKK